MGDFYLLGSLQFTSVFVFGLPFSVAAMMREKPQHSTGWLLLAPGFGSTLYFSVGTLLHFLGLRAFSVFWVLVGMSTVASIALLRSQRRPPLRVFAAGTSASFLGAVLALVLDSVDLKF